MAGAVEDPALAFQGAWSEDVVVPGLTGEKGPLPPIDGLRVRPCWLSVNQEVRRTDLGPGLLVTVCSLCR